LVSEWLEAYEDLAAAYEALAADAEEHGYQGSAQAFRDLAEHAHRFAQQLRESQDPWR
jgi:rubrerythrin